MAFDLVFGGHADDYLHIHKFMDTSKLFYFNNRHRILLHHTYGIDLCIQRFGEKLTNTENKTLLIRDIAAEYCKKDLRGIVPTLNHWFKYVDDTLLSFIKPINPTDSTLKKGSLSFSWESGNDEAFVTFKDSTDTDNFENLEMYIIDKLDIPDAGEFQMNGSGDIYIDNNLVKAKYSSTIKELIDFNEETQEEIYGESEDESADKVLFAI